MDIVSSVVGAGTGVLASFLVALGLRDRIDRIERCAVSADTFRAVSDGLADRLSAVQADLTHQIESMQAAARSAEAASQAARLAAERAAELARAYIEGREEEAKHWRSRMDEKLDDLLAANRAPR